MGRNRRGPAVLDEEPSHRICAMALLSILRLLTSLLSLAVLVTSGYLLWSWYDTP